MSDELKILCPFCNQIWDAKMEMELDYSMGTEMTGVYGEETVVEIYCSNCEKLVYTKREE